MTHSLVLVEWLPSRTLVAGAIIALHVTVAYFLITGLIHQSAPVPELRTQVRVMIASAPVPQEPILRPRVILNHPAPTRPRLPDPPVGPLEAPVPEPPGAINLSPSPEPLVVAAPAAISLLGQNRLPDTEEYYPPARRRDGVEGVSDVRVCVDERGIRQGEPVIERSSGDADLDRGALNVARHGRYARAVQAGQPVPNCYHFRITFRMR